MRDDIVNHAKVLIWVFIVAGSGFVLLQQGDLKIVTGSTLVDIASDEEIEAQAGSFNLRAVLGLMLMFVLLFVAIGALSIVRKQEVKQMKKLHIEDYVRKAKEKGFDDEHICQRLVEEGWEPNDVIHHFLK